MKEGIFVGPQIKQLFKDIDFSTKLNAIERWAWEAFERVSGTFYAMKKQKIQWHCAGANCIIQRYGV